jgi:hypothetical protein
MWHALTRHNGLKAVAIVLATAVWFYVNLKNYDKTRIEVPVHLRAPNGWFILASSREKLDLTIHGRGVDFGRMNRDSVYVDLDINARRTGELPKDTTQPYEVRVGIEPADVRNLPPGILVDADKLALQAITVTLDRIVEKGLTVSVNEEKIQQRAAEGTHIHRVYLTPKRVFVQGPQSVLARIETIEPLLPPVENWPPVEWRGLRPLDTTPRVDGKPIGPPGCLKPQKRQVDVWIVAVPETQTKTLTDVRIDVRGRTGLLYKLLGADKKTEVKALPKVALRGPQKALDNLSLLAFVDVSDVERPSDTPAVTREVQFDVTLKKPLPEEPDPALSGLLKNVEVITKPPRVTVQITPQG